MVRRAGGVREDPSGSVDPLSHRVRQSEQLMQRPWGGNKFGEQEGGLGGWTRVREKKMGRNKSGEVARGQIQGWETWVAVTVRNVGFI